MLRICTCRVVFPASTHSRSSTRKRVELTRVKGIHIEKNFKNLTSTANVKLASRIYFQDAEYILTDLIKAGDAIELWIGYDNNLTLEFTGFVSVVNPRVPLELECEDYMYLLKRVPVNMVYSPKTSGSKLEDLLKLILPKGMTFTAVDTEVGEFKAKRSTVAKVLEKLKEINGMFSYFKGKQLIVGQAYSIGSKSKARYNVEQGIIKNNLTYRYRQDDPIKVVVKNYLGGGSVQELTIGTEGGEEHTCSVYGISSEAELTKLGNAFLNKMRLNGFTGSIETQGLPVIDMTDVITLYGSRYPDLQDESYFVDGVKVDFEGSFKRTIELGQKV